MRNLGKLDNQAVGGLLVLVGSGCFRLIFYDDNFDVLALEFELMSLNLNPCDLVFLFYFAIERLRRFAFSYLLQSHRIAFFALTLLQSDFHQILEVFWRFFIKT